METGNPSKSRDTDHQLQIHVKKPSRQSKEPFKVKYISSPVMVSAKNAVEFKAIVQELTGKDSSDGHQQRTPAGDAANAEGLEQLPSYDGERDANVKSYEVDHRVHCSSTTAANEVEDDVIWKLPESLSRYEFPFD